MKITLKQFNKQKEEIEKQITELENSNIKWTVIGDLEWSECLGEMDWKDAMKKCKEFGGRLPTRIELIDLYDNYQDEIKDFVSGLYWSSTENSETLAHNVSFSSGSSGYSYKTNDYYVRCCRSIDN